MSESNDDGLACDLKPVLPPLSTTTANSYDEIVIDSDDEDDNNADTGGQSVSTNDVDQPGQLNCAPSSENGVDVAKCTTVLDTFTLSSDEEEDNVTVDPSASCNSKAAVKSEVDPECAWKEQIDQYIISLTQNGDSTDFDTRCQKVENDFECLEKDLSNISEQCQYFEKCRAKYAIKETHISGEGSIDSENSSLKIQETVQRIVKIDTVKREVSEDIPINDEESEINLGQLTRVTHDPDIDIVQMTTLADLQEKFKLPKTGPIVRKPLAVGDQVFASTDPANLPRSPWQPATIIEICRIDGKIYYNVTYEDSFIPCILLRGTQIAYRQPPSVMLTNKSRVIALYTCESGQSLVKSRQYLLSGLIAEVAKRANSFRYLVFFDNGYVAYVPCDSVHLIAEEGLSYLDDIPEERKPFLSKYFADYPERALVKYQLGGRDFVLFNDKWIPGRVKQVDCSLVRFYFRSFEKYEWIYRGSPRLKPLANLLKAKKSVDRNGKQRALRKGTGQSSILAYVKDKLPYVQYVRDEDNLTDDEEKRSPSKNGVIIKPRLDPFAKKAQAEFELFPELVSKPDRLLVSSPHVPHRCSEKCINIDYEDISKFRDINPYAIPVICGWDRQICSYTHRDRNKKKRAIFYVAPCGRRFRNIEEVDIFLSLTKSNLSIDLFTFHPRLVLYSELNGKTNQGCYYYEPDVTQGTENHSISCINWINDEPITPGFQYWPTRFPGRGVNLELDPHFLVCCDCTDNCRDKSKCDCQRLTRNSFEIIRVYLNLDEDEAGYNYRRLEQVVSTGVWECNSNCACSVNCNNRVVQHGIRVRLQIFKTKSKGWGIRCLHDIPPGAFICIYAAELLNEDLADEVGSNFGDEYLADLDYIETVEQLKEGYESAVYEVLSSDESVSPLSSDQESEPRRKNRSRKKTSKANKNNKKAKKSQERPKKPKKPMKPIRELYGEYSAYSLDAKRKGNVGRYFNHSCDPNCYVQNVFIDTHDLRFPWVALFSSKFIPAFAELTWDYNYEIIEGRKLWCQCGASNCRGRLL